MIDISRKKVKIIMHAISVVVILGLILLSLFCFTFSIFRLVTSFKDLGNSFAYYFCELMSLPHDLIPTVINPIAPMPDLPFFPTTPPGAPTPPDTSILPPTFEEFKPTFITFLKILVNADNFFEYFNSVGSFISGGVTVLMLVVPLVILIIIIITRLLKRENNNYNMDTKPLKIFKAVSKVTYIPVKSFVVAYYNFLKEHSFYVKIAIALLCITFNLATIAVEFFAYYFYLVASMNFLTIYTQIVKLIKDLSVIFLRLPLVFWLIIIYALIDKWRKSIALLTLVRNEMRDREFLKMLPLCLMVVGTMGKKKTTMLTDMALSEEVILRDTAFKKLLEVDLKFPNFPYINLENEIKCAMQYHQIYSLATCIVWIQKKAFRWRNNCTKARLFDYDYEKYGSTYYDNLNPINIWESLQTYTQLYFIYVMQSSILVSNYSIRVDNILQMQGNFPLWNVDFFSRDNRLKESFSRHAHILDFDMLRLGKKIHQDNVKANAFEFGVVVITEVGKERGNMLDTRELKKSSDDTNQKNDLFISWLKMCRHSSTVDNFPFIKVLMDEQRPESLGADARELCQIIHIRESLPPKLAMPFFFVETLVYDIFFSKFSSYYYDYRFSRGDNGLIMYGFKAAVSKLHNYYTKIHNLYGYSALLLDVEDGTLNKEYTNCTYYLSHKKIYSDRFSTDCFSEYFAEKSLQSRIGINDLKEFASSRATFAELQEEDSYFINDLMLQRNLVCITQMQELAESRAEQQKQELFNYLNTVEDFSVLDKLSKAYELKQKLAGKMAEDVELLKLLTAAKPG